MRGSAQRLRALALDTYLWAQRCRWPLPAAVRSVVSNVFAGIVDHAVPDASRAADEWPRPPIVPGGDPVRLFDNHPAKRAAPILPTTSVRSTRNPLWPDAHQRLRCMVATGTLYLGGSEMVASFLARGLPSHGLDTVLAHAPLAHSDERPAELLRLDDIPVAKLSQRDVQQALETNPPDVISMHSPPAWFVAAAAEAGIPSIETLHGAHSIFDRKSWPSEQLRSQQITGFVAVSELVRRQYLRANPGYPPDRIITIPNGVDDRHISHRDRAQARAWLGVRDEFLFVSLARYALQKNTFGLLTAFAEVARAYPEVRLLVAGAGDPPYFEQVRRLRDGLACAGQIHLRGPCPDVSAVLAAADAFVLDSFFEGWSLASMEALYAGLPVVLSEVGGAREQVGENGRRGFVVGNPAGDAEGMDWRSIGRAQFSRQGNRAALVDAMSAVIANRERWRDAREGLRADAVMRFSADICLQRHAEVLTRAVAGERLSSPAAGTP
jgi:glycosyltransferase involved in cell wall biosynthesis